MSTEDAWRAARALSEAAANGQSAANRIEEATQNLRVMFEHGYGGNALLLIELLQAIPVPTVRVVTAARIQTVLRGLGCVTNSQASDCAEAVMAMLYGTETDEQISARIYDENHQGDLDG